MDSITQLRPTSIVERSHTDNHLDVASTSSSTADSPASMCGAICCHGEWVIVRVGHAFVLDSPEHRDFEKIQS